MPEATCIVLTHDCYTQKDGCVELTLRSLLEQRHVDLEIVVVANACDGANQVRLSDFLRRGRASAARPVRVVATEGSIAAGRNTGARSATAPVLVFVDDDTVLLEDDGIARVVACAQFGSHGYGAQRLWTPAAPWFRERARETGDGWGALLTAAERGELGTPDPALRGKLQVKYLLRSFIGNFGYVRQGEFWSIGGFPEEFGSYGYEDDALSASLYARHGDFVSLRELRVAHLTHPSRAIETGEQEVNRARYEGLLERLEAHHFHIGDLLYPESAPGRPILERRAVEARDGAAA